MSGVLRIWLEVRIALHFWRAMRLWRDERLTDAVAGASAMALTRALRRKFPDQPLPYTVELTAEQALDV